VSYLLDRKKCPSISHVCHTSHHKVTTKAPRLRTDFRENPCKNAVSPQQKKALLIRVSNLSAQ